MKQVGTQKVNDRHTQTHLLVGPVRHVVDTLLPCLGGIAVVGLDAGEGLRTSPTRVRRKGEKNKKKRRRRRRGEGREEEEEEEEEQQQQQQQASSRQEKEQQQHKPYLLKDRAAELVLAERRVLLVELSLVVLSVGHREQCEQHTHANTHTHSTHKHTYTNTQIRTYAHTQHTQTQTHTHEHTNTHIHAHTAHSHKHKHALTQTQTRTHPHTNAHTGGSNNLETNLKGVAVELVPKRLGMDGRSKQRNGCKGNNKDAHGCNKLGFREKRGGGSKKDE